MKKAVLLALILGIFYGVPVSGQAQDYAIENVAGDLYLFKAGGTNSVFLVTDEGIILADPISAEAATWLKGELDQRFGQPVRYVIYSHGHADHASGGAVFAETAEFVSHYLAADEIAANPASPAPDIRFPHRYRLALGGKVAELYYFGPSHSDNLITVYFPDEKAVFLVDAVGVRRLPYRDLPDYHVPGVIAHLMQVEEMEFEILIPGHGNIGVKRDLADHRKYLQDLALLVGGALQQGFAVGEMKTFIQLEPYRNWDRYGDWRALNIEGMARIIREAMAEEAEPEPVKKDLPEFPDFARKMWISGWVALSFEVTGEGRAADIRVVDSGAATPTRGITDFSRALRHFEESAVEAVRKYRFEESAPHSGVREVFSFYLPPKPGEGEGIDPFTASQFSQTFGGYSNLQEYQYISNLHKNRR